MTSSLLIDVSVSLFGMIESLTCARDIMHEVMWGVVGSDKLRSFANAFQLPFKFWIC